MKLHYCHYSNRYYESTLLLECILPHLCVITLLSPKIWPCPHGTSKTFSVTLSDAGFILMNGITYTGKQRSLVLLLSLAQTYWPFCAWLLLRSCNIKNCGNLNRSTSTCAQSCLQCHSGNRHYMQAVGRSCSAVLIPAVRDLAPGAPNAPKAPAAPLSPRQTAHRSLY